jgi:CRP/FNR family transcriptional regulator, cyclic AMP receptor protein
MTAAVDATHHLPTHPMGDVAGADAHGAKRPVAALPTPAPATVPAPAAAVISFDVARYTLHSLSKGETLYLRAEPAHSGFLVEAGLLALAVDGAAGRARFVGLAGPGDLIGALSPVHPLYLETVTALGNDVVVRSLPSARQALEPDRYDPALVSALHVAAGEQLARVTHALEDAELPVSARVARAFVRLGERFGHVTEGGAVRLTLPVTHDTLAALVGAARETTTTVVQQLRDLGLVEGTRGRYRFDPARLRAFALEAGLG